MSIILCQECDSPISDKAKFCPHCGFPMQENSTPSTMKRKIRDLVDNIKEKFPDPENNFDASEIIRDLTPLRKRFSPGYTLNGIGTSMGGFIPLKNTATLGFTRKYFCILFIPVIFLDIYLVKDWNGHGGKFIGKISNDNAQKYINISKQKALIMLRPISTWIAISIIILILNHK